MALLRRGVGEVRKRYVRPPGGPECETAGALAAQSPEAARRAEFERNERLDGAPGGGTDRNSGREGVGEPARASVASMSDSSSVLLTVAEAAALAGFSNRAIYRAISRGELRAVRVCSRLRIPRRWFDEWIERSVVEPERPMVLPPPPPVPAPGSFTALLRQRDLRRGG